MDDTSVLKALITGASSGIGATYADRLARRGHDLVLVARDTGRMEELAARLRIYAGRTVEVIGADLTVEKEVRVIADRIGGDERIGLLINNAGMTLHGTILDEDPANVARLISLNVQAVTTLAGAAARAFPARGSAAIVNLSSVLALAPERIDGVYNGSKAYVLALSQWLAQALADKGVRVQAVLPGLTRTEIWSRVGKDIDAFPREMIMSVDDMVDAALVGLDRGETVTIPSLPDEGQWTALTDARLALWPNLSRRQVAGRYASNAN